MVDVTPDPRPERTRKRRRTKQDRSAAELFKRVVCSEPCLRLLDGDCEPPLQAAHVVPKQTLWRRGLGHLVYDPLNGVSLCYRHHRRHDSGLERIQRVFLPARCLDWAAKYGVLDELERNWP